jgi:hypothetical protein
MPSVSPASALFPENFPHYCSEFPDCICGSKSRDYSDTEQYYVYCIFCFSQVQRPVVCLIGSRPPTLLHSSTLPRLSPSVFRD